MAELGETVLVPTQVDAGAFPGERLVTVDTEDGPVSGFASEKQIVSRGDHKYLFAEVKEIMGQMLLVKLAGSFFTTTGIATLPKSDVIKAT